DSHGHRMARERARLASPAVRRGRLLERDDQVRALAGAIDGAVDGEGSVWLVAGPAGIGKTALLDVAGEIAAERGMLVLRARASELDRGFGFGIVHQLFEPV